MFFTFLSCRENEVLKVQLKKYVGAVQMLKREGQAADGEPRLSGGGDGLHFCIFITSVPGT